jgi:hypothetical protein
MIGILKKMVEITDKIAFIGIPEERIKAAKKAKNKASVSKETDDLEAALELESNQTKKNSELAPVAPVAPAAVKSAPAAEKKPAEVVSPPKPPAAETKPAPAKKEEKKASPVGDLSNLFKQAMVEEVSPLQRLSASMPVVDVNELLVEVKEVEALLIEQVTLSKARW